MENEKSSAEITNVYPKTHGMFVIKGRQTDYIPLPAHFLYYRLNKFIRIKNLAIPLFRFPLDSLEWRVIKRLIDVIISIVIIVTILSWAIPIVALLSRLEGKGPLFVFQKRNKRNGKIFTSIKFRSPLKDDANGLPASVINENAVVCPLLRKRFIEKLPQFVNVLIGDMSIIGPCPDMIAESSKYEELTEFYHIRHKVKPGITGLPQVMGYHSEAKQMQAVKDRVLLDVVYIRHWSPGLDLKIIGNRISKIIRF